LLGSFDTDEYILVIYKDGSYELMGFELTNRYEPNDILILEKYQMSKPITAIHYDHENKNYYVKRFAVETQTANKKFTFINEAAGSKLLLVSTLRHPMVKIYKGRKKAESIQETFDMSTFIDVKGWKANGNKIASGTDYFVAELLEPNPELEKEDEGSESKEVVFEIEPPENNIYTDEVPPLKDFKEFKPEKKGGSTKDPGEQKSLF
jgi:topoisomerase-4 subunit A